MSEPNGIIPQFDYSWAENENKQEEKRNVWEGAWRTTEDKEQRVPSKRLARSNTEFGFGLLFAS